MLTFTQGKSLNENEKDKRFTALSKEELLTILPDYRSPRKIKYTAKKIGMYIIPGISCNCKTNREIADAEGCRRLYVNEILGVKSLPRFIM